MSENKIKHVGALICWAVLHAYFLAFHFSKENLVVYTIAVLYLYCKTVQGDKNDKKHVVDTLSVLVGTTFAVFLAYYFILEIVPLFVLPENAGFTEVVTAVTTQFKELFQVRFEQEVVLIQHRIKNSHYIALIAAVVFFIRRKSAKHPFLGILFRYLWSGTLLMIYIDMLYNSPEVLWICIAITMMFVASDMMYFQHNGSSVKVGKRWYNVLSILLLIVMLFDPNVFAPFTEKGYLEYYFLTCGFKWYTVLFLFLVLFVTWLVMITGFDEHNAKTNTDIFVVWDILCVVVTVFFMSRFYVGYWWVVATIYTICVIVAIVGLNPVEMEKTTDRAIITYLFLLLSSLAVIITVISGHYGYLLQTWTVIVGIIVSVAQYLSRKGDNSWLVDMRFYGVVLLCIALSAAVCLWCNNRYIFNFQILTGIFLFCLAVVYVVSKDSGLFAKRSQIVQIITVVLFAMLSLSLCSKNSIKIAVLSDKSGKTNVEISAKHKERTIECVEYYWLEDYLQLEDKKSGFPKEVKLSDTNIPQRDGRLRVVVTDNLGTQAEKIYWVHVKSYDGVCLRTAVTITDHPVDVTVAKGLKAKATVTAIGDGLIYKWYYKDVDSTKYTLSSITGKTYSTTMSAEKDGRKVYCVVTDQYGRTVKSNVATLYME